MQFLFLHFQFIFPQTFSNVYILFSWPYIVFEFIFFITVTLVALLSSSFYLCIHYFISFFFTLLSHFSDPCITLLTFLPSLRFIIFTLSLFHLSFPVLVFTSFFKFSFPVPFFAPHYHYILQSFFPQPLTHSSVVSPATPSFIFLRL